MIWAVLALKQKSTRARLWDASPKYHVRVLCSPRLEMVLGNTHENAILLTRSAGPVVTFSANHALSLQKCRRVNVPLLTNTWILVICIFLTGCVLVVFNGSFFPPGSVLTVWFGFPLLGVFNNHLGLAPLSCLSLCQTTLLWATKPCKTALLHPGESIFSAARQTELSCLSWEGLMQKAALSGKSCRCQSVHIREPLLSRLTQACLT